MILLALHGLLPSARALDGTGVHPSPATGGVTDPLVAEHPARPDGVVEIGVMTEVVDHPLTVMVEDADESGTIEVIGSGVALQLAAAADLGARLSLGVAMPVWVSATGDLTEGGALGDARVRAAVALVRPGENGGFGFTVAPWIELPTGDASRYLGTGALGGGARAVVGYGVGPLQLSANVGGAGRATEPTLGVDDRGRAVFDAAISWRATPGLGLTLEAGGEQPIQGALVAEARLSGRGRVGPVEGVLGTAVGLGQGAGTARWRAYAGVGVSFGPKRKVEPIVAPVLPPSELRVTVRDESGAPLTGAVVEASRPGETRTATVGADGVASLGLASGEWTIRVSAPGRDDQVRHLTVDGGDAALAAVLPPGEDGDAHLAVRAVDADGAPVETATVRIDGVDHGTVGGGGALELEGLSPGEREIRVEAPGFRPGVAKVRATEAAGEVRVVLDRPPGSVHLAVRGPAGPVADAEALFTGPEDRDPLAMGPTGEQDLVLVPGRWQLVVSSPGYGVQSREIVVSADRGALLDVQIALAPIQPGQGSLGLRVVDPDGNPLEGVELRLDGVSFGRTSSGGALRVESLEEGPRTLELVGEHLRPVPPRTVDLVGTRDLTVPMRWQPGSVAVRVRGPDGPAPDAQVRFDGPSRVAPTALGADGEGFFSLAAGDWLATLASARFGVASQDLRLGPDDDVLRVVESVLRAEEAGDAALVVRVRDPDDAPVEGATVRVDGLVVGTTASGGTLHLEGLQAGRRNVVVEAPMLSTGTFASRMEPGSNVVDARLGWAPGAVLVRAQGPDGAPVDGLVRFYGAAALPPAALGDDGVRRFALTPGAWTMVVASDRYGLAQQDVVVPESGPPVEVLVRLAEPGDRARLLVEVVDPDGAPVHDVRLTLERDTRVLPGGALVLDGLPLHLRGLRLEADGYAELREERLELVAGPQERRFVLKPVPRAVSVRVVGPDGKPVTAAVRVARGSTARPPLATGADGRVALEVAPGDWDLLISAPSLGASRRPLHVDPGTAPMEVEIRLDAPAVAVTERQLVITGQILFRFNEATLTPESLPLLDALAATLRADPGLGRVEIQGHTDAVGAEPYNLALSQRRADAVRDYLIAQGVDRERLVAVGYGTSRAQAGNDTEAGRAKNRRVQFERIGG